MTNSSGKKKKGTTKGKKPSYDFDQGRKRKVGAGERKQGTKGGGSQRQEGFREANKNIGRREGETKAVQPRTKSVLSRPVTGRKGKRHVETAERWYQGEKKRPCQ